MSSDPYRDPDIRDPNEEPPARAPEATQVSPPNPGATVRVGRGTFNAGWTEVIRTLAPTLTDEQKAILQRRYEQLTKRGPSGR